MLQLGGLLNAFGNGLASRSSSSTCTTSAGIGLGVAGLILATNGAVRLFAGPARAARSSTGSAASGCSSPARAA